MVPYHMALKTREAMFSGCILAFLQGVWDCQENYLNEVGKLARTHGIVSEFIAIVLMLS